MKHPDFYNLDFYGLQAITATALKINRTSNFLSIYVLPGIRFPKEILDMVLPKSALGGRGTAHH
jgi:hypothetical protein